MNVLTHKGYIAAIEIDAEADLLSGLVTNVSGTTLHFAGRTIDELKAAFADTVADYEDWCRERGKEPQKPYSGTLSLRLSPDLHARLAMKAAHEGKSLNGLIAGELEKLAG